MNTYNNGRVIYNDLPGLPLLVVEAAAGADLRPLPRLRGDEEGATGAAPGPAGAARAAPGPTGAAAAGGEGGLA